MNDVQLITNADDLSRCTAAWNECLAHTPDSTFFHTLEWLQTYWKHFGRHQKLRVFIVRNGDEPIGIMPLVLRRRKHRFGNVRVLGLPLHDLGAWRGPIGADPAATIHAVAQHIRSMRRDWDLLELRSPAEAADAPLNAAVAMIAAGFPCPNTTRTPMSVVDFDGTWDGYLATKPKRVRHDIRKVTRCTFESQNGTYIRFRPSADEGAFNPRWDLYEMCKKIACTSWQARTGTATTLTDARVSAFLRDAHAVAARLAMVDVNLLTIDGQPISFSYNYHVAGRLTGLRLGYDTSATPTGYGRALVLRSLEDSFERGDVSYNLGTLDSRMKSEIQTRTTGVDTMTHIPYTSVRGSFVRLANWIGQRRQPRESRFHDSMSA